MVEVLRPLLAEWAWVVGLTPPQDPADTPRSDGAVSALRSLTGRFGSVAHPPGAPRSAWVTRRCGLLTGSQDEKHDA